MSALTSGNPFQSIANQLSLSFNRSEEEQIFAQAIQNVCTQSLSSKLTPALFDRFRQAKSPEEFLQIFDEIRAGNALWKVPDEGSLSRRIARIWENILHLKPLGDSLALANQAIAAPVWGCLCAVLSILQNILDTDKQLEQLPERLRKTISLYSTLYTSGAKLNNNLRAALLSFNEFVVKFCFTTAAILQQTKLKSWLGNVWKQLHGELLSLSNMLVQINHDVEASVHFETYKTVQQTANAIAYPPIPIIANTQPGIDLTWTQSCRVPSLVSTFFTGRDCELRTLSNMLHRTQTYGLTKCCLVGIGGIGKSQLALKYAQDHSGDLRSTWAYRYIMYVRANDKATLLAEFRSLAENLGLCDSTLLTDDVDKVIERVKMWLHRQRKWLLIFDNVVDSNDVLYYLPEGAIGHVLMVTRNTVAAASLVAKENIMDLSALDINSGSALALKIAGLPEPVSDDNLAAARSITEYAQGLPLLIEQIVKSGCYFQLTLANALKMVEDKQALLGQQGFCLNHEQNLSVGAVVSSTLNSLDSRNPKCSALFQLLVHFKTATIPLYMLKDAGAQLRDHFERPDTYVRGQLRTSRQKTYLDARDENLRSIRTPENESLTRKLLPGFSRRRTGNSDDAVKDLPRSDSAADRQLQDFYLSQVATLRIVLEDDTILDNALTILDSVGLIRRVRNMQALWIHDRFADIGQALVTTESLQKSQNIGHLASTMVYLNFPTPAKPFCSLKCTELLPHAITAHKHLKEAGILNDATIGAELSHLIASIILSEDTSRFQPQDTDLHMEYPYVKLNVTATQYYQDALTGYRNAWERLMTVPGITREHVIRCTRVDFAREYPVGYVTRRHQSEYERFGRSALWRYLITMSKIGGLLMGSGHLDEATQYIPEAARLTEEVFGQDHPDTRTINHIHIQLHKLRQDWQAAYMLARRMAENFMHVIVPDDSLLEDKPDESVEARAGLCDTIGGSDIASIIADCAGNIPGKEREALRYREIGLMGRQRVYGQHSSYCSGAMYAVADANERVGDLSAYMYWLAKGMEVQLEGFETPTTRAPEEEGWTINDTGFESLEYIDENVARFRKAREKVGPLDDHKLEAFVWSVELRTKAWDVWKDILKLEEVAVGPPEAEEFEDYIVE